MKKALLSLFPIFITILMTSCGFNVPSKYYLSVKQLPDKITYNVGEAFSTKGLEVVDQDNKEIKNYNITLSDGHIFSIEDMPSIKVEIFKNNYESAFLDINVTNYLPLSISGNFKTNYKIGDAFTLEGLKVTCNGETINDYQSNIPEGYILDNTGQINVEISKAGYLNVHFIINVSSLSLVVASLPNKTTYLQGEHFSTSGLIIKDEMGRTVTGYDLSIKDGEMFKYQGNVNIEVSKDGYNSTYFTLKILENILPTTESFNLNVYYINDTHGSFIRQHSTYYEAGMSYIGHYLKERKEIDKLNNNESLILSGGDMFEGGYESNETHGKFMAEVMNEIGFDAMALGNHEFSWGEQALKDIDTYLDAPILSINTFYNGKEMKRPDFIKPYTIVNKGKLKIGIIGACLEEMTSLVLGSISKNFTFPNPTSYIKECSSKLRINYNCDFVFSVFHDPGFEGTKGEPSKFYELTKIDPLCNQKYIDGFFFAHDHTKKSGMYEGIPYIESACNGQLIGILNFEIKGNGVNYSVDDVTITNYNAYNNCSTPDQEIENLTKKDEYKELMIKAEEIIYTFKSYHSRDELAQIFTEAIYWYVNSHKEDFDNTTVYFSSYNYSGIRSAIYKGDCKRRDLIKALTFENLLSIQTCSSKNISYLERSSYYVTYKNPNGVEYFNNITYAVSVNYLTENIYYQNSIQTSYKNYPVSARFAFEEYLNQKIDIYL